MELYIDGHSYAILQIEDPKKQELNCIAIILFSDAFSLFIFWRRFNRAGSEEIKFVYAQQQ